MTERPTVLIHGSRTKGASARLLTRWPSASSSPPRPAVVVEVDDRISRDGTSPGVVRRTLNDYFSEADAADIDDQANRIAEQWYRLGESDPTEWEGISLGPVICDEMTHFLIGLLKNIFLIDQLVVAQRPRRILLGEGVSLDRWAVKASAKRHGVVVDELPLDPPAPIEPQWDIRENAAGGRPSRLRRLLHAAGTYWRARRADRADRAAARAAHITGLPVVLSFDDFTAGDPRHDDLSASNRLRRITLYRPTSIGRFYRRYTVKRRWRDLFLRLWRAYEPVLADSPLMRYRDVDLWPVVQPWLHRQFDDAFPYFVAQGREMNRRIEALKPSMLMIPWVYQGRCSLATAVARGLGVPVGVVQTYWGLGSAYPDNARSHLPVDHFFLWSAISRTWCEFPAQVQAKIHYVAHPSYVPTEGRAADYATVGRTPGNTGRRPGILMTAQYWGPWTAIHSPQDTDDMWPTFVQAARRCPQFDFIAKIHPNMNVSFHEGTGGAQRLVNALTQPLPDNFHLAPLRSDGRELLAGAKRDFLPEALETGYAMPVKEPEQLAPTLRRILSDRRLQQRMNQGRRRFLRLAVAGGENLSEVVADVIGGRCACEVCRQTADGSQKAVPSGDPLCDPLRDPSCDPLWDRLSSRSSLPGSGGPTGSKACSTCSSTHSLNERSESAGRRESNATGSAT